MLKKYTGFVVAFFIIFCRLIRMKKDRLKQVIVLAGITMPQLAEEFEVATNTVWRWSAGKSDPSDATKKALAQRLNTSIAYLMGETDNPRRLAEPQSVNATANEQSSNGQSSTATSPEAKTNVTNEGEGIIFEFEPGKRIVFPKGTPQKIISATIETVLKNGEIWHRSSPQLPPAT
jgi:transcriptional regulator with XRE-family HTH domain